MDEKLVGRLEEARPRSGAERTALQGQAVTNPSMCKCCEFSDVTRVHDRERGDVAPGGHAGVGPAPLNPRLPE